MAHKTFFIPHNQLHIDDIESKIVHSAKWSKKECLIGLLLMQGRGVTFDPDTLEQAEKEGYTPCPHCYLNIRKKENVDQVLFSVNQHDKDGDVSEEGIFLHFGKTSILVAKNLEEFRQLRKNIEDIEKQLEDYGL